MLLSQVTRQFRRSVPRAGKARAALASQARTRAIADSAGVLINDTEITVPKHERLNPGIPLDLGWITQSIVNKSGVDRRASEIAARRSVKKNEQTAWLLRAVTCIDLTTLAGDDTHGKILRMCGKAKSPVRSDILSRVGLDESQLPLRTAAVCVYPARVKEAVAALQGTGVHVAAVATGFPSGQILTRHKLEEIQYAVRDGATEIDIVISRDLALCGRWEEMYHEVSQFRAACGDNVHMKAILSTGELGTLRTVYQASLVCMMAGADFVKTSTGMEKTNATLSVSLVMLRSMREYMRRTGALVGFKPAGGIGTSKQALVYMSLMKEELGTDWLHNDLFRFGASSLLTDIERQLYHRVTQNYAASHYMPMG